MAGSAQGRFCELQVGSCALRSTLLAVAIIFAAVSVSSHFVGRVSGEHNFKPNPPVPRNPSKARVCRIEKGKKRAG